MNVETKQYTDGTSATGTAPLPDQSPAQQDFSNYNAPFCNTPLECGPAGRCLNQDKFDRACND